MARKLRFRNAVLLILGLLFGTFAFAAPAISTISPTVGPVSPVGSALTINGSGFGTTASGNTVTIGGVAATPTSWSDTKIVVPVPGALLPGFADVIVTSGGTASNTASFLVIPVITAVSPAHAPIGGFVTITGTSFGDAQGTSSTVTFNGLPATPSAWTNTSISFPIPTGATSGAIVVNVNGWATNGVNYFISPTISSLSPASGAAGGSITISGSGFGAVRNFNPVTIGGVSVTPTSWSDTAITIPVPTSLPAGNANVVVTVNSLASNAAPFIVTPSITSISADAGAIGATITIAGASFGATQGTNTLTFNGVAATPSLWSDTSITVLVPGGATTGPVLVSVNGIASNSVSFTVNSLSPTISALNPTRGVAGAQVTITGTSFGPTQGDNQVQIGSLPLTVKTWSDTAIVATIPPGSTTGDIVVTGPSQQSNGMPFTVIVTPLLSGSLSQTVTAVTLTSPVALDWEHWGTTDDQPLVRMAGSQFLLSDLTVIGSNSPALFSDGEIEYLWTDGDVLTTAERTTTGISINGTGNGFHLSVPADAIPKTLMLYVGASNAQGQLTASISDNSSAPYIDSSLNVAQGNDLSGTYRIDFRATQLGQTLNIDYVVLVDHGNGADLIGKVNLESAELFPHLPDVATSSPQDGQIFAYPSQVSAAVDASQIDFAIAKVDFLNDTQNLFELTTAPYSFSLVDLTPGDHVLTATATDVNGMAGTSDPVTISQIQGGGSLSASIDVPVDVDLSAGTTDWVHWGNPDSPDDLDRKAGISPQISDLSTLANGAAYTSDETGHGSINYSWSGGTPTVSQAATGTQIFMQGYKNGFTITIAADTTVRTAKLYVGYGSGTSKFRASLSDGSAVPWVNTFTTSDFYNEKVITLQFQAASPGQTLIITDQVVNDAGFAYVDLEAATVSDQNSPVINTISPITGGSGTVITISGSNFDDSLTGKVTLNGNVIAVNSWTDTSITATLSAGYSSGPIVVSQGMANSNSVPFTYLGPSITALMPSAGGPGTIVSIQGQFLSNGPGTASVTFGGIPTPVASESATSIQVAVPAGISFGPASVIVQVGGVSTNAFQFDVVQAPVLISLTPNVGGTGKIVKITGSNLGRSQADSGIFFGDFEGTPISWSETQIEVPVPAGFYGGIVMALVAGHWSNGLPFEVPARCIIDCNAQRSGISLSPQNLSVVVGDQVDLGVTDNLGESVPYSIFTVSDPTIGSVAITNGNGSFTALAPGTTTVTATSASFTSSTTVTVYPGPALPDGTIKWQVPVSLTGTSAQNFIQAQPAVGSATATFFEDSSDPQNVIIRALDANGRLLWAWPTETNLFTLFNTHVTPTPAGGFVYSTPFDINSIDANGHPLWSYQFPQYRFQPLTVGYDGTVYALVNFDFLGFQSNEAVSHLVALDAQRGTEKFRVPLPKSQSVVSGTDHDSSGMFAPENISRPMVLADGSINLAVSDRISTSISSPNTHQAIPQNNSHDPNSSGSTIYCPSEILECWAPVDSSGTAMKNEVDTTEGKQINLLNIQPNGSYKQYLISNSAVECDQFGSHFKYVLDDALLLPFFHVGGTVRDSNGNPVSDGHQYAQEMSLWFTGTCGVGPFGPNGFDLMVVPNGTGGLLVASETDDAQNPVWIKNIPQPSVSGAGTEIHIASLNTINNLVIGENGNAFAAGSFNFFDTPRLVSFNLASGSPNWTYDSTFHTDFDPGYVDIVAAGPNNSLYAVEGGFFNVEPKVAFTLDANGVRTDNPTSNQEVTFVASAGIGSTTWLGANVTQIASLGGSGLPFGMPFVLQSSPPLGVQGVTAIASTLVNPTVSTYGASSPAGTEGRPWYFVLVWQNDFTFTPDYPNRLPALTTDITSDATVIKAAALKAMKDAYKGFWIVIAEGTSGTGDHRATVMNSQTLVHAATCGATNSNVVQVRDSQVDYLMNMQNAQDALKVVINNSQDEANALKRIDLLQAIGRGIGVTAAHEIAHHFLFLCCAMDADPGSDPLARGTYNATGCSGSIDPSPWTGFWPNPVIRIHWEPATLRGLNECLSAGWRDFGSSSCHQ